MYRIDESIPREKYTMLVPATLDAHFPLIKYMFWSREYRVEILDNTEGITDVGLAYANNEMCYPFILMVGQVIKALRSGKYEVDSTRLLIPTAGDACRGACYIGLFKRVLAKAGLDGCKVLTLNVRHVEEDINLKLGYGLAVRGLFGMYYGDILMILANQVRPYEKEKGAADRLWKQWVERLSEDLKTGKHLTLGNLKRNYEKICRSFAGIERSGERKQRIGIVGEFYAKYCSLGNWDVVKYLEEQNCETHTNGLSWYALYYVDTHMPDKAGFERTAFLAARKLLLWAQDKMIESLQKYDFYTLPNLDVIKKQSEELVSQNLTVGDGWLMGAEVIGHIRSGCLKNLCIAPFGCMPNVCAGRGIYPYLQRCFPESSLTSVETDASGSKGNYYNRVQMLVNASGNAGTNAKAEE